MNRLDPILHLAVDEAARAGAHRVEPIHLFTALCLGDAAEAHDALRALGVDPATLGRVLRAQRGPAATGPGTLSQEARVAVDAAHRRADRQHREATSADLLCALLDAPSLTTPLRNAAVPVEGVRARFTPPPSSMRPPVQLSPHPDTPLIDRLGVDYTALARRGALEGLVDRFLELRTLERILRDGAQPLLIGQPSVGKHQLVRGLALDAVSEDPPAGIGDLRVVELSPVALRTGVSDSDELTERVHRLVCEATWHPQLVLFVDRFEELLEIATAQGVMHVLEPAIADRSFRVIAATTPRALPALRSRFPEVVGELVAMEVGEPSLDDVYEILRSVRPRLEQHHGVAIGDATLRDAIELLRTRLPTEHLPGKARDLLDHAAASQRIRVRDRKRIVRPEHVREVLDDWLEQREAPRRPVAST